MTDTIANDSATKPATGISASATTLPSQAAPAPAASNGKTALADAFREHFSGDAPIVDKARSFAKARPWTSAAFVGVAALAVLNTLRGRR